MRPTRHSAAEDKKQPQARRRRPGKRYEVLLVDPDASVTRLIEAAKIGRRCLVVHQVSSIEQAQERLEHHKVDLAVIEAALPDGSGVALARHLHESQRITQTVLVSRQPDVTTALEAMRAGAADFLTKPLDAEAIGERLGNVLDRQDRNKSRANRVRRLRDLCRQLDQAREQVSQQVDTLCSDLVSAYQDLASQMDQAIKTSEYAGMIRDELDLEQLLRRSLEYVIEKIGPTNAIVFLPSGMDSYSVGAFVNFQGLEGADIFRDHLADRVAPRIAEDDQVTFVTDDATMQAWLGTGDAGWLCGRQVIGVPCQHEGETLAVLMLFRDQDQAYSLEAAEICQGMSPILAEALCRVIRVHHRGLFDEDAYGDGGDEQLPW